MRKSIRIGLLAGASLVALAFAADALATPTLKIVNPDNKLSGSAPTTISFKQLESDAPVARLAIYMPLGYTGSLQHTVGEKLGTVAAHIKANALGGANVPVSGDLVNDDPAKYTTAAATCTGSPTHEAVWLLNLSAAGQTLQVPVYVDSQLTAPESVFASFRLIVCLPPPQTAQLGAQLLDATFSIARTFVNPGTKDRYIWRGVLTPYAANSTASNPPATVEMQSIVPLPVQLTLNVRYTKKTRTVVISGRLLRALEPIAGVPIKLFGGLKASQINLNGKPAYNLRTSAKGAFGIALKIKKGFKGTLFFRATAKRAEQATTACESPLPVTSAPAGCVSANTPGFTVANNTVLRVRIL